MAPDDHMLIFKNSHHVDDVTLPNSPLALGWVDNDWIQIVVVSWSFLYLT